MTQRCRPAYTDTRDYSILNNRDQGIGNRQLMAGKVGRGRHPEASVTVRPLPDKLKKPHSSENNIISVAGIFGAVRSLKQTAQPPLIFTYVWVSGPADLLAVRETPKWSLPWTILTGQDRVRVAV